MISILRTSVNIRGLLFATVLLATNPHAVMASDEPEPSVRTGGQTQQAKPTVRTGSETVQNWPTVRTGTGTVNRSYELTQRRVEAIFPKKIAKQGRIPVGNATWYCSGNACFLNTETVPQISMCKGIVAAQGQAVQSFGDSSSRLNAQQLASCNGAITTSRLYGSSGFMLTASVAKLVVNQNAEPGSPGPNGNTENLINQFFNNSGDADADFNAAVGWSPDIWQDGEDPNTWYYVPREYRLQLLRTGARPVAVGFTHTYESDVSADKTVLMTATFEPPATAGDLSLIEALANSALNSPGGRSVNLQPFPIDSVEVDLLENLSEFGITKADIRVTDTPKNVRDPFSIRIRMNEEAQTTIKSLMRERGGLGGNVIIKHGDSYSAEIPVYMDLRHVSGYPFPEMREISRTKMISNALHMPVTMKGIVGYVAQPDGTLVRKYRPMTNTPAFGPRQDHADVTVTSKQANDFGRVFGDGVVHSWFSYETDTNCQDCIAYAERMMESEVDVLRKDTLTIDIPQFVFADLGLFKVSLQVRSHYFDSSGSVEEVRDYHFQPGDGPASEALFLDRRRSIDDAIGQYRIQAYGDDGTRTPWSGWRPIDSTDLTVVSSDFETKGK